MWPIADWDEAWKVVLIAATVLTLIVGPTWIVASSIGSVRFDLSAEIARLDTDLSAEIAKVNTDLSAQIADLGSRLSSVEGKLDLIVSALDIQANVPAQK